MREAGSCEHFLLSIFKLVTCHLSPSTGRIRAMKISIPLTTILLATLIAAPSFAQTTASSPAAATSPAAVSSGQPNPQEMMKQMMELSKLNENHKAS